MSGQPEFELNLRLRLLIACLGAALMTFVLLYVMTRIVSPGQDVRVVASAGPLDGFRVRLVDLDPRSETPETSLSTEVLRPVRPETRPVQPAASRAAAWGGASGPADAATRRGDGRPSAPADDHSEVVDSEGGGVDWWGELDREVRSEQNDETWLIDRGLRPYRSIMQGRPPRWAEHGSDDAGKTRSGEAWISAYGDVEVAINEHCTLAFPRNTSALDFERLRPALINCRKQPGFKLDLSRTIRAPFREED